VSIARRVLLVIALFAALVCAASVVAGGQSRTGAICNDGWRSSATGSGACSHHGGVAYWLYSGPASSPPTVPTVPTPQRPTAPSLPTSTVKGATQVDLSWSDTSASEAGFRIERRVEGGSYSQIATVAANATSYSDTGLSAGTRYCYRVRAYNTVGDSGYSNETCASTSAAPQVPLASGQIINELFVTRPSTGFWTMDNAVATSSFSSGQFVLQVRSGTAWGRMGLQGAGCFSAKTRLQMSADNPGQAAGILFAYQSERSFRVFFVTGNGFCGLWQFDGAAFQSLSSGWRKDEAILLGGVPNQLEVVVRDGSATCLVNGKEVLRVPASCEPTGDIGLAAMAWNSGQTAFDGLEVDRRSATP
jgi:hypothetical protein